MHQKQNKTKKHSERKEKKVKERPLLLCDTASLGINPIPSKYKVIIADTNTFNP